MVDLTTLEAIKHLKKFRKQTGVDKDVIIAKLVEMLVEEGIGNCIVGSFEIPEGPPGPVIKPSNAGGSHKQGELSAKITPKQIQDRLGKGIVNRPSGDGKCKYQWFFTVDGVDCAIWDYKGSRWSTFGPAAAIDKLGLFSK